MGKFIGGLIGLYFFGFLGMLAGLFFGHLYDQTNAQGGFNTGPHPDAQRLFFETLFKLLGYIAKADGRVSEEEIAQAEALMGQLGVRGDHRQQAISHFKQGSSTDFNFQDTLFDFEAVCGRNNKLKQTLLVYLISMALADGEIDSAERDALKRIAQALSIPGMVLDQIINMIGAQAQFRQGYTGTGAGSASPNELATAYQALGVDASATDAQIKRAYRKLMSENHPDKLAGQGVPEHMIEMATTRSQEISRAYDLIKASRKR